MVGLYDVIMLCVSPRPPVFVLISFFCRFKNTLFKKKGYLKIVFDATVRVLSYIIYCPAVAWIIKLLLFTIHNLWSLPAQSKPFLMSYWIYLQSTICREQEVAFGLIFLFFSQTIFLILFLFWFCYKGIDEKVVNSNIIIMYLKYLPMEEKAITIF